MSDSTRNQNLNHLARFTASLLVLMVSLHAGQVLPVFLADNHAETAGWITRNFDLDAAHVLVLVDAHSDASAAERSEGMREELRRVASEDARAVRVENWRAEGRIQAFNWIEPLLPRPLDQVLWLAAPSLDARALATKSAEAAESLDGRLEVEPRSAGSFSSRLEICDLAGFGKWQAGRHKVILAIDLDFFAGMKAGEREAKFAVIWERAMDWPGLEGVAFAVSRPWLTDDGEADALVTLALDAVRHTRGARLEIDASVDDRPDGSLKAAEMNGIIPRWDLAKVSPEIWMRMLDLGDRLTMHDRKRSWDVSLWKGKLGSAHIVPESGEMDCDHIWRYPLGSEPVLRVVAPTGATGRTRWFLLEPVRAAYDLLPETGLGKGFADSPARWIYEKPRSLGETQDFQLDPARWRRETGGRYRIAAECETASGWLPVPAIEIRVRTADGFRGALSECAAMPYVFGIAGVRSGELTGVDSGWGSDCANLLVHAWRRNGISLAWGDPGRLRLRLASIAEDVGMSSGVVITPAEIARGIAIDFGSHVSAIWEDKSPLGVLDGHDLVMHHLGGFPEIVPLAALAATRPVFSVRVPEARVSCRIKFVGDVVLAGEDRVVIDGFEKADADGLIVNLEGIPSLRETDPKPRYNFRFPPERLGWLKSRGVDAVSLANNHAADAGEAGIVDGIAALEKIGIGVFGAGKNDAEACRPIWMERKGVRMAIFGISCFGKGSAGPNHAGVAVLPKHRGILEEEFQKAWRRRESIVVMMHWGNEYDAMVDGDQRRWARWLIARGAASIVGSHPHVIQRAEIHGGAEIHYSLGNAVFPRTLKGSDSGTVREVEIPLGAPSSDTR